MGKGEHFFRIEGIEGMNRSKLSIYLKNPFDKHYEKVL